MTMPTHISQKPKGLRMTEFLDSLDKKKCLHRQIDDRILEAILEKSLARIVGWLRNGTMKLFLVMKMQML